MNECQASRAQVGLRHTLGTPGQEAMRVTLNPAGHMDGGSLAPSPLMPGVV